MSNLSKSNICSEDIFPSFSELNESKLRRSQRIINKAQKSGCCISLKNISEKYEIQNMNTLPSSSNMELQDAGEDIHHQFSESKTELIDEEITQDFTFMWNTSQIWNASQLEEAPKQISNLDSKNLETFGDVDGPNSMNSIANTSTAFNDDVDKKKRKRTAKRKANTKNLKNNSKKIVLDKTSAAFAGKSQSNECAFYTQSAINNESKNSPENEATVPFSNFPIKEVSEEPLETKEAPKEVLKLSAPNINKEDKAELGPKIATATKQICAKIKKQKKGCPKMNKFIPSNSADIEPHRTALRDYVPPKVMRYYNTCSTVTHVDRSSDGFLANNRSLLPAVYPPHFTQQIATCDIRNTKQPDHLSVPITFLTPENSQVLPVQKNSIEANFDTPHSSSPLSIHSLQNFFEIEELDEILNGDKIIYYFKELHVQALALELNMNSEYLMTIMDKIVVQDEDTLREQCSSI